MPATRVMQTISGHNWLYGVGVPDSSFGSVGQFYLDTETDGKIYLKTSVSTWEEQENFGGGSSTPAGIWWTGSGEPINVVGNIGDFYNNTATGEVYSKTAVDTWVLRGDLTEGIYEEFPEADKIVDTNTDLNNAYQITDIYKKNPVQVGDKVLFVGQTNQSENGLYDINALKADEVIEVTYFDTFIGVYVTETFFKADYLGYVYNNATSFTAGDCNIYYYSNSGLGCFWNGVSWSLVNHMFFFNPEDPVPQNANVSYMQSFGNQTDVNGLINEAGVVTITPAVEASITRNSFASTSKDFIYGKDVVCKNLMYKYKGQSNPVLGVDPIVFDKYLDTNGYDLIISSSTTLSDDVKNKRILITDGVIIFTGIIDNCTIHSFDSTPSIQIRNKIINSKIDFHGSITFNYGSDILPSGSQLNPAIEYSTISAHTNISFNISRQPILPTVYFLHSKISCGSLTITNINFNITNTDIKAVSCSISCTGSPFDKCTITTSGYSQFDIATFSPTHASIKTSKITIGRMFMSTGAYVSFGDATSVIIGFVEMTNIGSIYFREYTAVQIEKLYLRSSKVSASYTSSGSTRIFVLSYPHNFVNGDIINITSSTSAIPVGNYAVTVIDAYSFSIVSVTGNASGNVSFIVPYLRLFGVTSIAGSSLSINSYVEGTAPANKLYGIPNLIRSLVASGDISGANKKLTYFSDAGVFGSVSI